MVRPKLLLREPNLKLSIVRRGNTRRVDGGILRQQVASYYGTPSQLELIISICHYIAVVINYLPLCKDLSSDLSYTISVYPLDAIKNRLLQLNATQKY